MAIDHDRLFKELIETFFEEFMLAFFPEAHEAIDFSELTFLTEEVFTDVTAGDRRRVDLLVQTRMKGEESIVIVHIESQSYVQNSFNERMFIYFSRLYEKYRKPILPVAVFSYDEAREEPDSFKLAFPFVKVLDFHFNTLQLRRQNWRDYIRQDNPAAAALLSKMGYAEHERIQVKIEFLRMLTRMSLNPARLTLVSRFFDTYFAWDDEEEEEQLRQELHKLKPEEEVKIMELKMYWEKKAEEKGKIEGKLEGLVEVLCKFLNAQYGEDSKPLQERIKQTTNAEQLERLTDELFKARTLVDAKTILERTLS